MRVDQIFFALLFIGGVIFLGEWVRRQAGVLQRLYLPSSIIGGILALLVGPDVLGRLTPPTAGSPPASGRPGPWKP